MNAVIACYSLKRGMFIKNGGQCRIELIDVGIERACRGGVERRALDIVAKGGNIDGAIVSDGLGNSRGSGLIWDRKNG